MEIIIDISKYVLIFTALFLAPITHELAHGYMAYYLGDPTAKLAGRLSINPIKHIDPFGTIILPILLWSAGFFPLIIFKPVPINPLYFKNPKKDNMKVAIAGPAMNFFWVILTSLLLRILLMFPSLANSSLLIFLTNYFFMWFIMVNLVLGLFNLMPFPPLDGSWILLGLLPDKYAYYFEKARPVVAIAFFLLVITGIFQKYIFRYLFAILKKLTLFLIFS